MSAKKLIQIQADPPETHYFIYKSKKYPFNMNLFNVYSKYFLNKQDELQYGKNINIFDESTEKDINFSEEAIQDFINYSQRQQIYLTTENVLELNYLSKKYEIDLLIQATEQFIEENQKDLILKLISTYQNNDTISTETYESIVSNHLEYYINDDMMLSLNLPIIYRIISKFLEDPNRANKQKNEINEFLFKCLSKFGRDASFLFSLIHAEDLSDKEINSLLNEYSEIFDFHYINESILKSLIQYKKYEEESYMLKKQIEKMKEEQAIQKQQEEENMKKYKEEIEKMKKKYKNQFELNIDLLSLFVKKDQQSNDLSRFDFEYKMTEILLENDYLNSPKFLEIINHLNEVCFEIKYPSEKFVIIYNKILEIKNSYQDKVKISIFITGVEETDFYFCSNNEINRVTLDSCVKRIAGSNEDEEEEDNEKKGSFTGCSSLTHITLPSSLKFIGRNAFTGCKSLESISIPSLDKKIKFNDVFSGCKSLMKIEFPSATNPIPVPNIDDYEITELILNDPNNIFKGVNKKTGKEVVIKHFKQTEISDRINAICGANVSQIDLPGLVKTQSFRYPLTNKEKQNTKLQSYEKTYESKKLKIDLTGYIAISEFMKNGNIFEITERYLKTEGKENEKMNPTIRSKIIFGVAATMKSLHKRKIIHRNLTNVNVLLDDKLEPRIGSFSLARFVNDPCELEMAVGTTRWMAPETFVYGDGIYSYPVDVYSYSIFLYFMFSLDATFPDKKPIRSQQQFMMKIGRGDRPVRPERIPDHYWELINKCWKQNPEDRPTFEEITAILKEDKYVLDEFGMKTDLDQLHEYQRRIDVG